MSNDLAETDEERERLRICTSSFYGASFHAEETRGVVDDVRSSANGINQGVCIERFVSIDDGNRKKIWRTEKWCLRNLSMTAALNCDWR